MSGNVNTSLFKVSVLKDELFFQVNYFFISFFLFLQVVNGLRYFGVGCKVTRSSYKYPDTYWTIQKQLLFYSFNNNFNNNKLILNIIRVRLSKDQNHGKIYGQLVWRGKTIEKVTKVCCPLKKEWKLVSTPDYDNFKILDNKKNTEVLAK